MDIESATRSWLEEKRASGRLTPGTLRNQTANVRQFINHVGNKQVADITRNDFASWVVALSATRRPGSVNTITAPIRAFFVYARSQGMVTADPCASTPRLKIPDQDPKSLSRSQIDRIVNTPVMRPTIFRDKTILIVTFGLGLRIAEVANLRVEHWDPDPAGPSLLLHRKGGKVTRQPVEGDPAEALRDWISRGLWGATEGPMWPSPKHPDRNLDRGYIGVLLKRMGAEVGVPMHAHMLRHTIATFMAHEGVPQTVIQAFLDHSSSEMTSRYVRSTKTDVRRVMLDRPGVLDHQRLGRSLTLF